MSNSLSREENEDVYKRQTQGRCYEPAKLFLQRRRDMGNTGPEARRALKRKLSDVIYRTLLLDAMNTVSVSLELAA